MTSRREGHIEVNVSMPVMVNVPVPRAVMEVVGRAEGGGRWHRRRRGVGVVRWCGWWQARSGRGWKKQVKKLGVVLLL